MRQGYERVQIDRIISVMRDAMRSLVARVVSTYDNELSMVQRTLQSTYSGWDSKDIPANLTMLLRDFAIRRDSRVDAEIARITASFELIEKLVRDASGYDDEDEVHQLSCVDDETELHVDELQPHATDPAGTPASEVDEVQEDVGAKILSVLRKSTEAKSLDDLIAECCDRDKSDRTELSSAIRILQESGALIEVDLDTYQVNEAEPSWG